MNYMWLYVIMISINHVVNKMGRKYLLEDEVNQIVIA
jgi:hypothetical protein